MKLQDRVPTGIQGFDTLIEGGLPMGSLVVLAGNAGSGKTTFAAEYAYRGAARFNQKVIYVSFAEGRDTFYDNMLRLGMNFASIEKAGKLRFHDMMAITLKSIGGAIQDILHEIRTFRAARLVVDPFSAIAHLAKENEDPREILRMFLTKEARSVGCTSIMITEIPSGQEAIGMGYEEFVSDGIIVLYYPRRGSARIRGIEVRKMRKTNHLQKTVPFEITSNGIVVHPESELLLE